MSTRPKFVHLAETDAGRIQRIRDQSSFEEELENAAEDVEPFLATLRAQREGAKKARIVVTVEGATMVQVIEEFVFQPEHRNQPAKWLWPVFFAEIENRGLKPSRLREKDAYEYEYVKGRRQLSRRRFENVVSAARKRISR
jgi:hypothetical protein